MRHHCWVLIPGQVTRCERCGLSQEEAARRRVDAGLPPRDGEAPPWADECVPVQVTSPATEVAR